MDTTGVTLPASGKGTTSVKRKRIDWLILE